MAADGPLIGRREELVLARAALSEVGGVGHLVLAGAAGVGKTRLARELVDDLESAGRGCTVQWVRLLPHRCPSVR